MRSQPRNKERMVIMTNYEYEQMMNEKEQELQAQSADKPIISIRNDYTRKHIVTDLEHYISDLKNADMKFWKGVRVTYIFAKNVIPEVWTYNCEDGEDMTDYIIEAITKDLANSEQSDNRIRRQLIDLGYNSSIVFSMTSAEIEKTKEYTDMDELDKYMDTFVND